MKIKNHLPLFLFLVLLAAVALLSLLPAAAAETDNPLVTSCGCNAYVVEADAKGLGVRSGPGEDYPVTTTLDRRAPVYITGSVGEWMRISTSRRDEKSGRWVPGDPIGWAGGRFLAVKTYYPDFCNINGSYCYDPSRRVFVFSRPINGSTIITMIPEDTEVTIAGCWLGWIKVRYKGLEGWLIQYCLEPYGSCWW